LLKPTVWPEKKPKTCKSASAVIDTMQLSTNAVDSQEVGCCAKQARVCSLLKPTAWPVPTTYKSASAVFNTTLLSTRTVDSQEVVV